MMFKLREILGEPSPSVTHDILGPTPATIARIKRRYRWRIIIKHSDETTLRESILSAVKQLRAQEDTSDITINVTLDPLIIH